MRLLVKAVDVIQEQGGVGDMKVRVGSQRRWNEHDGDGVMGGELNGRPGAVGENDTGGGA